jgi:hypothetical protein
VAVRLEDDLSVRPRKGRLRLAGSEPLERGRDGERRQRVDVTKQSDARDPGGRRGGSPRRKCSGFFQLLKTGRAILTATLASQSPIAFRTDRRPSARLSRRALGEDQRENREEGGEREKPDLDAVHGGAPFLSIYSTANCCELFPVRPLPASSRASDRERLNKGGAGRRAERRGASHPPLDC